MLSPDIFVYCSVDGGGKLRFLPGMTTLEEKCLFGITKPSMVQIGGTIAPEEYEQLTANELAQEHESTFSAYN